MHGARSFPEASTSSPRHLGDFVLDLLGLFTVVVAETETFPSVLSANSATTPVPADLALEILQDSLPVRLNPIT
jgi:hypothetical protein